jgi:hypothetical protein
MRRTSMMWHATLGAAVLTLTGMVATPAAQKKAGGGANGTTLAAQKTIEICSIDESTWRVSGVVNVWNAGAIAAADLVVTDTLEVKVGSDDWKTVADDRNIALVSSFPVTAEPGVSFPYSFTTPPLVGTIRNSATATITNHSGSIGVRKGPNPKVTYYGDVPPAACASADLGCSFSQGYWKTHPEAWPIPGDNLFPDSWSKVMDEQYAGLPAPQPKQAYNASKQYIAARLNAANRAFVPAGVQDALDAIKGHFDGTGNVLSKESLATNAGILETFNTGSYPDGPPHCG